MRKSYEKMGNYLRECREATGLSGYKAANKVGIGPSQYSRWELGHYRIPEKYFPLLAQSLGANEIKLHELTIGTNETKIQELRDEEVFTSHNKDILPLLEVVIEAKCKKVSVKDLLFLKDIQENLPQKMTSALVKQLLDHRYS